MGTIGFGVWIVSGRSRVPFPPASRIAFIATTDDIMWQRRAHESPELAVGDAHFPGAAARRRPVDEIRGAADLRRAEGDRWRRNFRSGVAHRLGRRLSGETTETDHAVRTGDRSARRQA